MANPNDTQTTSLEEDVDQLNYDLDRLRTIYEQYFTGIERIPPVKLRDQINRTMRRLLSTTVNNTALKFKINSIKGKLVTYSRLWDRTLQQMEDGTYKRDRFKAKLRVNTEPQDQTAKAHTETTGPEGAASAPSKSSASNPQIDALMKQYIAAKKQCKENVDGVDYNKFAKTLINQSSQLRKRFNCKSVSFKVVIENGKTKLKATPK